MESPMQPAVETLDLAAGRRLAFARTPGAPPTVVFLAGFRSDMAGGKATYLEAHCRRLGRAYLRFDYRGHGASSGRFADGTIGGWHDDALAVIDHATEGDLVLVGSSMGGWIMLLAALARSARVKGLVGIAAAPDFTERLIRPALGEGERAALGRDGVVLVPSAYGEPTPITRRLLDEARRHLLLGGPIPIRCPVHLLHGQQDPDVPWRIALELAARIEGGGVTVELVKDGDHRLSREEDLRRIAATVERVIEVATSRQGG
jgi:pimeloyl-ACP methyl ester carboxylesterase